MITARWKFQSNKVNVLYNIHINDGRWVRSKCHRTSLMTLSVSRINAAHYTQLAGFDKWTYLNILMKSYNRKYLRRRVFLFDFNMVLDFIYVEMLISCVCLESNVLFGKRSTHIKPEWRHLNVICDGCTVFSPLITSVSSMLNQSFVRRNQLKNQNRHQNEHYSFYIVCCVLCIGSKL